MTPVLTYTSEIVLSDKVTYTSLCARLAAGDPFAFSRWGDGEWSAVLGRGGQNCDGQAYTAALGADLRRVLLDDPPYLLGLQALAVRRLGAQIAAWLLTHERSPRWVEADLWHRASIKGRLDTLFAALAKRRVLVVGPAYLQPLAQRLSAVGLVEIPATNAYNALPSIRARLPRALGALGKDGVVAVSAGMSTNLLIHDYCARVPAALAPRRTTWIDFGALWEPYVGVANRTYHQAVVDRLRDGTR